MDGSAAALVGGFFALRTTAPPDGAHRPLARLYTGESAPLTARIDTVAARLGTSERRVAASVAHLGLASRLWSVALGPAALTGHFPALPPGALYWDPGRSRPPTTCGWTGTGHCPAPPAGSGRPSSTATWCPLPRRSTGTAPCPTGCCGATPVPRWPEPCGQARRLGAYPPPPRRGRAGPRTGRRTLRPPGPAEHRSPARRGVPPPQLLSVLPHTGRRPVR